MQNDRFDPGHWIIAESEHYYIRGEYEYAFLHSKKDNRMIAEVGSFYGDPETGLIDWNERFCVTVGCGCIIYFLREPFGNYWSESNPPQAIGFGDEPNNIMWIEDVRQISDNEIELVLEDKSTKIIEIPL